MADGKEDGGARDKRGSKASRGEAGFWEWVGSRSSLLAACLFIGALALLASTMGLASGGSGDWEVCSTEGVPAGLLATIRGKMEQRPVGLWVATDASEANLAALATDVHLQLAQCGLVAVEAVVRLDREGDLDRAAQETAAAVHTALHAVGEGVLLVQVSDAVLEAGLQEIVEGALDETMPELVVDGEPRASHGLVLVVYSLVPTRDISGPAVVEEVRKSKRGVWDDRLVQRFGEVAVVRT